jgi:hypothetical protein
VLLYDDWRQNPEYDRVNDRVPVRDAAGNVTAYYTGPNGRIAIVGPGTGYYYAFSNELSSGSPLVVPIDGAQTSGITVEVITPSGRAFELGRDEAIFRRAGEKNKPVRVDSGYEDGDGPIEILAYGRLSNRDNLSGAQFTGKVAFVRSTPPVVTVPIDGVDTQIVLQLSQDSVRSVSTGLTRTFPFDAQDGQFDPELQSVIDRDWNVVGSVGPGRNPWYSVIPLQTVRHRLTFKLRGVDLGDTSKQHFEVDRGYDFYQALIPASRSGGFRAWNPPTHLRVVASAFALVESAENGISAD